MRTLWRLGALCGALSLLACSEDATGPRPIPTTISVAAGALQSGTVGLPLDTAITAFVTDKFGDPVPGVLVRFTAPSGHGRLEPIAQTTGPGGHAQASWTLPTNAGRYSAFATASGLDSVAFIAQAVPAAPASLTLLAGDTQAAAAAAVVDSAIVVLVQDGYGNPVAGASVSFAAQLGSGSVTPSSIRSDSTGRAETIWTLGGEPGTHALLIRVDSLPPLRVHARALPRSLPVSFGQVAFSAAIPDPAPVNDVGNQGSAVGAVPTGQGYMRPAAPPVQCWRNALGSLDLSTDSVALGSPGESDNACGAEQLGPF
jgi:hypothetical protein